MTSNADGLESGIERIAAERQRQISIEGWTPEHDDAHVYGELLSAAYCYFWLARDIKQVPTQPYAWPWDRSWWKPSADPIRNLEKAGALIAAEIDRLQRVAAVCRDTAEERLHDWRFDALIGEPRCFNCLVRSSNSYGPACSKAAPPAPQRDK